MSALSVIKRWGHRTRAMNDVMDLPSKAARHYGSTKTGNIRFIDDFSWKGMTFQWCVAYRRLCLLTVNTLAQACSHTHTHTHTPTHTMLTILQFVLFYVNNLPVVSIELSKVKFLRSTPIKSVVHGGSFIEDYVHVSFNESIPVSGRNI